MSVSCCKLQVNNKQHKTSLDFVCKELIGFVNFVVCDFGSYIVENTVNL